MSYKKVPWEEYSKAFRGVCRKMSEYSECRVHIVERGGTLDDPPIHLSVSRPSIGAVEPEEAKVFSRRSRTGRSKGFLGCNRFRCKAVERISVQWICD